MPTYADVCRRMPTYADVCLRMPCEALQASRQALDSPTGRGAPARTQAASARTQALVQGAAWRAAALLCSCPRVYARLGSREGCNVVGGKFNPEWPCGEMLLFSRVVLGAARARLLVEVMATTLYLYAAD